MNPPIECAIVDGVACVVMNDGKVNALTFDMLDALTHAVGRAREAGAMLVIRSGSAKAFSAGFDMRVLGSGNLDAARRMLTAGARLLIDLLSHPYPVIAICAGHAYPMGAFLLLASDIRIGVDGEYRVGINEVAIGIPVPNFALALAKSRVPANQLARVTTLGQMLTPAEACEAGFLDQLVAPSDVELTVERWKKELKSINHAAHASTKRRLRAELIAEIERSIEGEILPQY